MGTFGRMTIAILLAAGVVVVAGSVMAGTPRGRPPSQMKWWDVCVEWGRLSRSHANDERQTHLLGFLMAERMVNNVDRQVVAGSQIFVGMTECGVFAILGLPDSANNTTTAGGTHSQLVYQSKRMYIYTEPSKETTTGIVRAFQN